MKKDFFKTDYLGFQVKKVMLEQGKSITELANKINRSRTLIYDITERRSIDSKLLMDLSLALHYNFFALLSEEVQKELELASTHSDAKV